MHTWRPNEWGPQNERRKKAGRGNRKPAQTRKQEHSKIEEVPLSSINPSPENDQIYGAIRPSCEQSRDLFRDVLRNGILEPIVVSVDGFIVSGHRRYAAAKQARLKTIPVRWMDVRRTDFSAEEWKRELVQHNKQRKKSASMLTKEALLQVNPTLAHRRLIEARDELKLSTLTTLDLGAKRTRSGISKSKRPMLLAALNAINELAKYWPLSVRQVHYRLLNNPPLRHAGKPASTYQNDSKSYKDLCNLLTRARLAGEIRWYSIADTTRPVSGLHYSLDVGQFVARQLRLFLAGFRRDLMQSQSTHVEIVAEKLTVQGILMPVADRYCIPLTIGRGYCSIEPRYAIAQRFKASGKDQLALILASDLDPDGDAIAESLGKSMRDDFGLDPHCVKALLTMDQIEQWQLPPNSMAAKKTSARYSAYKRRYGTEAVYELEAVSPNQTQEALEAAIRSIIDVQAYENELDAEKEDAATLQITKTSVADHVASLDF